MADLQTSYNLKSNPFRLTPAINPDELVWAGFAVVKNKIQKRIERSIKISNSSLVLNWGEYGSGKTHAARYFSKNDVLTSIAGSLKVPFPLVVSLPKGKEPVYSIYVSVIDKLNIDEIRSEFEDIKDNLFLFIDTIGTNIHIKNVLKAIFDENVDSTLMKKYLYGNINSADLKSLNDFEILRSLKDDTDYIYILAGLFSCLTYNKAKYSCVILWIDEFEDIAVMNNSNIDKTNNFIREILDNVPNNFLLFLNLTQSALFSVEDLGQYVYESVRSRIKERISFDLPKKEQFKEYVQDLLDKFRMDSESSNDSYFPFTEEVIESVIDELGNVSLRRFNESLSLLLELSEMDGKEKIDDSVLEEYRDEIFWNKD